MNELCPTYAAAAFSIANTLGNISGTVLIQSLGLIMKTFGNTSSSWAIIFVAMGVFNLLGKFLSISKNSKSLKALLYHGFTQMVKFKNGLSQR